MTVGVITRRYQFDGVVTTIDLTNADRTLDAQPEALKQAAMADCLLLRKTDLAEPAVITALEQRLRAINPSARRLRVHDGVVAPRPLLELGLYDPATKIPDVARWLGEEAFSGVSGSHGAYGSDHEQDHGHDGHHDHAHDLNRHDDPHQRLLPRPR